MGEVALTDFETFYRADYPKIFRAAFAAAGDRDVAFDATQEAFKRAYARWRRLGGEDWATAWVMTTALNLVRRRGRNRELATAGDVDSPTGGPSADRIDVMSALRALPHRQQQAVVLFYIGDFTVPEIAAAMGITEGGVKAHLAQGREALRTKLEERHA